MEFDAAISCTIVMIIASLFWYSYCERIYLRFYWNKQDISWHQTKEFIEDDDDVEPRIVISDPNGTDKSFLNPLHESTTTTSTSRISEDSSTVKAADSTSELRKRVSFMTTINELIGVTKTNDTSMTSAISLNTSGMKQGSNKMIIGNMSVVTEGYLSYKCTPSITSLITTDTKTKWKRHYFILLNNGSLYAYKTRQDYKKDPTSPYMKNPIKIFKYSMKVQNLDIDNRLSHIDTNTDGLITGIRSSVASSASGFTVNTQLTTAMNSLVSARFQITMIPIEIDCSNSDDSDSYRSNFSYRSNDSYDIDTYKYLWLFRMDTEEELDIWVDSMQSISPSSFKNSIH